MLYEIRTTGDSTGADLENDNKTSTARVGWVGYVHGLGIDQPLALFKGNTVVVPHVDWRGTYDAITCLGTAPNAGTVACPTGLQFPGSDQRAGIWGPRGMDPDAADWYGSLIWSQQDATGYQYKRNRYYDTQTGRFTQEDPIGLAGGLNLHGLAGGDPVNYADPFGLCPPRNMAEVALCIGQMLAPAQVPLEIAGTIATAPLAGGMGMAGEVGLNALRIGGAIRGATAAVTPTIRVLGRYPAYLQVGKALGAKVFNVPVEIWKTMSPAARWAANEKFLARGVREGAEFVLASHPSEIVKGTALWDEVMYLLGTNKYKWAANGLSLIPK